jgi:hypothetical protein
VTKNVLILGAGTAGALVANTLVRTPDLSPWEVTVVDRAREHVYLPGLLFLPFRLYGYDRPRAIARERGDGLVVVPLAGLFEDSARHVARAGYPRLREFRGLARGAFVMLGTMPAHC